METTATTVMFDGQFWIAIIEKTKEDGTLCVGRHVFGAEPSNPELVAFMLDSYSRVPVRESLERVRVKRAKKGREEARVTGKALRAFSQIQSARLLERKDARKREADERERFLMRVERRKERKRGH